MNGLTESVSLVQGTHHQAQEKVVKKKNEEKVKKVSLQNFQILGDDVVSCHEIVDGLNNLSFKGEIKKRKRNVSFEDQKNKIVVIQDKGIDNEIIDEHLLFTRFGITCDD